MKKALHKFTDNRITLIVNAVTALVATMFYFSEHTMLGFVGFYTFKALPYILGALAIVSVVLSLVILLYKNNRAILLSTFIYNAFIFIFSVGYFFGLISHCRTFLLEMAKILAIYLFFAAIVYLCFFHGKKEYRGRKAVAVVLCSVILVGSLLCFTDFSSLRINFIDNEPVVYAVGEDYQIVWTTAAKGSGYVQIGDNTYYDGYAGQKRTNTKVHKVTVPQSVLDENKGYTVLSKAILSEQGFTGLLGYTVKKSYNFRPVDTSDGIQGYFLSDTHDFNGAAIKAASYYGEALDFLVLGGDHVHYIDNDDHLARALNLAHGVTQGERPVVYARGNHELKCADSETLDRYVGSSNGNFYYTFRLQNVWGIVLDMGEDHDDDWKEFYGTAIYDSYRKEQITFLDNVISDKENEYDAEGVEYRIGICHIPTAMTEYVRPYMFEDLVSINDRLNVMGLDVMLSGHQHLFYKIEEGYEAGRPLFYRAEFDGKGSVEPEFIATGAQYPNIVCCRSADDFAPSAKSGLTKFTGTAFEFLSDGKYIRFTNRKKEVIYTVSPFDNIDYGKVIEI